MEEKRKSIFNRKREKRAFLDILRDFKEFEDKYFIVIKESQESGLELTIASKDQKNKKTKKEEKE